eukprot:jgi/Bigna1/70855/fgenesh1_pg.13_\
MYRILIHFLLRKRGETIAARSDKTGFMVPGGKGANQATAVAKASSPKSSFAQLATVFGNDGHARALSVSLEKNNVDTKLCLEADVPSGQAIIFLEKGGENSIIIIGGANNSWPDKLPTKLVTAIQSAATVLLQQEIPDRINLAVAKCAKETKVPVMMDVGGEERELSDELLSSVSLVSLNETELARLTGGMKTDTKGQCIDAAKLLLEKGCKEILVTLGKDGAILISPKAITTATNSNTCSGQIEQEVLEVDKEKIVDTTGAGDCFRGAFAVARAEGKDDKAALRFAAAAASLCIQVKGAQPSMPTREAILDVAGLKASSI